MPVIDTWVNRWPVLHTRVRACYLLAAAWHWLCNVDIAAVQYGGDLT